MMDVRYENLLAKPAQRSLSDLFVGNFSGCHVCATVFRGSQLSFVYGNVPAYLMSASKLYAGCGM